MSPPPFPSPSDVPAGVGVRRRSSVSGAGQRRLPRPLHHRCQSGRERLQPDFHLSGVARVQPDEDE
eukprot:443711-Hanusia_phi.AAC.2